MKKPFAFLLSCLCLLHLASCDKDVVETNAGYQALQPSQTDADAGTWTPLIVSSAADFPLSAPEAATSAAYQQELAELKTMTANLTADQKRIINYWKVGSMLRWNEIMRELVAKHNLR